MAFDIAQARHFVESVDLRGFVRKPLGMDAAADAGAIFDAARNQAQVVGSGLFSFAQGVQPPVREAVSNSALFAQLVANKQVKFEEDPERWYTSYSGVLQNIGWTLTDKGWSDYSADGSQAEVNQKILELLKVALGPAPAALAIITSAMNALQSMAPNSPWITLWNRETQKADMARFQVGLVDTDASGAPQVNLVACILKASGSLNQILFFKWREAHATFKAATQQAFIDVDAATDLGPAIRGKIRAFQSDYLSSIQNL